MLMSNILARYQLVQNDKCPISSLNPINNMIPTLSLCHSVSVPLTQGTQDIFRKDIGSHITNDCPFTVLECPHKPQGCSHTMPRHRLDEHLDKLCKFRSLHCPYTKYGCDFTTKQGKVPMKELQRHLSDSQYRVLHLELQVLSLSQQMEQTQQRQRGRRGYNDTFNGNWNGNLNGNFIGNPNGYHNGMNGMESHYALNPMNGHYLMNPHLNRNPIINSISNMNGMESKSDPNSLNPSLNRIQCVSPTRSPNRRRNMLFAYVGSDEGKYVQKNCILGVDVQNGVSGTLLDPLSVALIQQREQQRHQETLSKLNEISSQEMNHQNAMGNSNGSNGVKQCEGQEISVIGHNVVGSHRALPHLHSKTHGGDVSITSVSSLSSISSSMEVSKRRRAWDIRNHGACVAHNAWYEGMQNTVLFRVGGWMANDEQETALCHVDGYVVDRKQWLSDLPGTV